MGGSASVFVVDRHSRKSRLCRFFIFEIVIIFSIIFFVIIKIFLGNIYITDKVEVDFDLLNSMPGNVLRRLIDYDLFNEFVDRSSV